MMSGRASLILACVAALATVGMAQSATDQSSNEAVARRQLESGRAFARQRNYPEALKDFRAVAETHATSSVADDALLEMARYYIDIAGDMAAAAAAVDAIVKQYATSDSAPNAYLLAGRLALARSRQAADLDAARASFERVFRLFPNSDAVPRALTLGGETLWYARREYDARTNLSRVIAEFPLDPSAAQAYLALGPVLLALGEPELAMEELQQVRNRWPQTPAAATALDRITLLHRLYVRARTGPAYAISPESIGPAKLQNVVGLAMSGRGSLHFASESGLGVLTPDSPERPPTMGRPRGLLVDVAGNVVAFDAGSLSPATGAPVSLAVKQSNGTPKELSNIQAVTQLSNGDWLVSDGGDRTVQRFSLSGTHLGAFAAGRMTHLATSQRDEVAGLDRDQKTVMIFDGTGAVTARIPLRATGYDLQDAEDVAFDAFGHLYVLDRNALAVFTPYPAEPTPVAAPSQAGPARADAPTTTTYRLLTVFAPPQDGPGGFRRATALALDPSGVVFLYDDRAEKVSVYR